MKARLVSMPGWRSMQIRMIASAALFITQNSLAQTVSPDITTHIDANSGSWRPTAAQVADATAAARKFLAAINAGRYSEAYAQFTPKTRSHTNEKQFEDDRTLWSTRQGANQSLLLTDLTWSKDPKTATAPGVYVAVGLSGHYATMNRYCGFVVLSQTSPGAAFLVNRLEETALDDKTAAQIRKDNGQAYLDQSWKTLSGRCPGAAVSATASLTSPGVAEVSAGDTDLAFASVAEARRKLKLRSDVRADKSADGAETLTDDTSHTVWSFTAPSASAYPAMIERRLVQDGQGTSIKMSVLCEASKESCDRLVKEARATNQANVARLRSDALTAPSSTP